MPKSLWLAKRSLNISQVLDHHPSLILFLIPFKHVLKKKCTNIVNARFQWMDQQLFSRPSRVIGRIHFRGSQTCTRNSCNFCLDNSFTTPTLLVAVVHVTRIVCSVVIFSLFPFFFFFFFPPPVPFSNACAFTRMRLSVLADRVSSK